MLEHLFGSKTRVKLLSLFLRHPDEAIFVRELTRRVGTQINAVRRELANLVRFGLIREVVEEGVSEEGVKRPGLKRKYYKVNKSFSLLPEITSSRSRSSAYQRCVRSLPIGERLPRAQLPHLQAARGWPAWYSSSRYH
jgi:predicted transcriptional regulator